VQQAIVVVRILFGAAFTIGVSMAAGSLLLRRLKLPLGRAEAALFGFLAGSACLSLSVFFLCLIQQAKPGVFLALGVAVVALWVIDFRRHPRVEFGLPPGVVSLPWRCLFTAVFLAFFTCYFINALAPEISPDGSGYHLGNVARYSRHAGFASDYHSIYASMPQGMEMLFLVAFAFGRHSAAAMVHLAFQTTLPLLMLCYGRRFAMFPASAFAAILVYACPVIGISGISAYNDVAVATLIYAVFFLLQVSDQEIYTKLLLLSGLLCGFACGIKYTAAVIIPVAVVLFLVRSPSRLLAFAIPAALTVAPWLIRNWIWLGNPVAPFFNAVFPNPYWTAASEKAYLADLAHYPPGASAWEIVRQVTANGGLVPGMLGPVFLLTPIALLALRTWHGRRLLFAAVVVAMPAYFNNEVRFFIPALPFLALAMGIAMSNSWGALPAVAAFHAVISWPAVLDTYCDRNAWRLHGVPSRAALRIEPEPQFIQNHLADYALKSAVEHSVAPGERIFSTAGRPAAYIDRDILIGYESTNGERLQNLLRQDDAQALKREGIGYLWLNVSDGLNLHGVKEIARENETIFYSID
jgi:hypothetical protein